MGEGFWDMEDFTAVLKEMTENLYLIANGSVAHTAVFSIKHAKFLEMCTMQTLSYF